MKYILFYAKTAVVFLYITISQNAKAGSEANLFVPNQYAPLSSFKAKSTTSTETLQFNVKPEIVQYVLNKGLSGWIAFSDSKGMVSLLSPTTYNVTSGLVTLDTNKVGKFVVVADGFTNDFPIVTHWSQSLNSGKGGFQQGARDGIGTIDFLPSANQFTETSDLFNFDPANPYVFNSEKYALFSSDTAEPNALVPGPERFVGENYSILKVTDLAATAFSLKSVESSGFPVLHRNSPWGFWYEGPAGKFVVEGIPAFQVVHSMILASEPDKPSLSTFVLPPRWVKNPTKSYPVAFNGFYDINQNFFEATGLSFVSTIGKLVNDGEGGAIGVLWNGGGAYGSQSIQLSSYFNVAYVLYVAQTLAFADLDNVVTMGISRGGSTALLVAANPYFSNYRVRYAIAYCPPTVMGEIANQWLSTNYPGLYANLGWGTGYKFAYQSKFVDPKTSLKGTDLFLKNVTGFIENYMGDLISPMSDYFVSSLKSKGTSVYLASGTNDNFIPFNHAVRYYDKLVAAGVSTQFSIGHRAGHNYFTNQEQILYTALKEVLRKTYTPFSGVKHFKRISEDATQVNSHIEFTPSQFLAASLPKLAWRGQKLKIEIAGNKNLTFGLAYQKIDDALWASSKTIRVTGQPVYAAFGVFSGSQSVQSQAFDIEFPAQIATGNYIHFLIYSSDSGANWQLVDPSHVPQPVTDRLSLFEIQSSEPTSQGIEITNSLNFQYLNRGWGLSIY